MCYLGSKSLVRQVIIRPHSLTAHVQRWIALLEGARQARQSYCRTRDCRVFFGSRLYRGAPCDGLAGRPRDAQALAAASSMAARTQQWTAPLCSCLASWVSTRSEREFFHLYDHPARRKHTARMTLQGPATIPRRSFWPSLPMRGAAPPLPPLPPPLPLLLRLG